MTTPAAARLYLAMAQFEIEGRKPVVFNPNTLPLEDLPVIFGFNNGGSAGWLSALAIAQDGKVLGGHICSDEGCMPGDLGVLEGTRPDRHENEYRKHYPNGYRMEFVHSDAIKGHAELMRAIEIAAKQGEGETQP